MTRRPLPLSSADNGEPFTGLLIHVLVFSLICLARGWWCNWETAKELSAENQAPPPSNMNGSMALRSVRPYPGPAPSQPQIADRPCRNRPVGEVSCADTCGSNSLSPHDARPTATASPAGEQHYWSEEYAVRPHWVKKVLTVFNIVDSGQIRDGFATSGNRRFNKYYSKEDNALAQTWSKNEVIWANPPWSIWPQVSEKIIQSGCITIATVPAWHSKHWCLNLLKVASRLFYLEVGTKLFELGHKPVSGVRWGVYIILVIPGSLVSMEDNLLSRRTNSSRRRWRRRKQQGLS